MSRFIPWCRADGSYSPVQCYVSYCYCVNRNGQEISNTRTYIETGKPRCTYSGEVVTSLLDPDWVDCLDLLRHTNTSLLVLHWEKNCT